MTMNETYLNSWNRTKAAVGVGGTDVLKDSSGRYRMYFTPANNTYTNFVDCYKGMVAANPNNTDIPKGTMIDTAIKIISYFESKYTCSGICKPALFYYTLNLNAGVPSTTCLTYFKTEIGSSLSYLGITAIVTGGVMFFIWIC